MESSQVKMDQSYKDDITLHSSSFGASYLRGSGKSRGVSHARGPDSQVGRNAFDAATSAMTTDMLDRAHSLGEMADYEGRDSLTRFLHNCPHFFTLPPSELQFLGKILLKREFAPTDVVHTEGSAFHHVFIVLDGSVEVFHGNVRVGGVTVGNLFGFDSVIFESESKFGFRAGSTRATLGLIPSEHFLKVLGRNSPMAQSVGRKMAERMDVFVVFKQFCRHIFSHEALEQEYLPLWHIVASYISIGNCIHSKMRSQEIDTGAWGYAVHRLPINLTNTFCFELARALPPFLATRMKNLAKEGKAQEGQANEEEIRYIATKERRRCSWQLGLQGKTVVLLRDGFTDLLDFISCMCIHIIESQKLRARLQGMVAPPAVDILDSYLHCRGAECILDPYHVLNQMPLTETEQRGLVRIWGNEVPKRMYEIIMHREEYNLRVESSVSRKFMTDPFHEWALNLRAVIMKALGQNPTAPMPDDVTIDILSSNTHSTKNCLSSFARLYEKEIMDFGQSKHPDVCRENWHMKEDLVYYLTSKFLSESPKHRAEWTACLERCGLEVMEDTALTGLQVDVLPVHRLDFTKIDKNLVVRRSESGNTKRHFILNMDFAFGAQADGITRALITTFGHHIRSFGVMGKAGGLVGDRGDIQFATHVLFSKSSLITEDCLDEYRACGNEEGGLELGRIKELAGGRRVHVGPVLTIPGTMLQNEELLRYYKTIWKCIGVEMEGSYFARQIRDAQRAGLLRPDVRTRFAYYTSDMPLKSSSSDASLALPMRPHEGAPALYCIARGILELMLHD